MLDIIEQRSYDECIKYNKPKNKAHSILPLIFPAWPLMLLWKNLFRKIKKFWRPGLVLATGSYFDKVVFEFTLLQQLYFNLEPYTFTRKIKIITIITTKTMLVAEILKKTIWLLRVISCDWLYRLIILCSNSDNEISYQIDRFVY